MAARLTRGEKSPHLISRCCGEGALYCVLCAAAYLSCSVSHFNREIRKRLRFVRHGRESRFARTDLDGYVTSTQEGTWQTQAAGKSPTQNPGPSSSSGTAATSSRRASSSPARRSGSA